jgi:hypothetical protein
MPARLSTLIPVGSPHIAKSPSFERYKWNWEHENRREQRDYSRHPIRCDLWLIDAESQSVLRCKTNNVSDAGLAASAPIGYGLAVGQRYEVRLAERQNAVGASPHRAASLGYATIIRSGIELSGDLPDRVGFAARFDVPQLIPR